MASPVYHTSPKPVKRAKSAIPAVRLSPHPGYPGSVATYVTAEGRLLPLWTQAEVERSYEVIELCRGERVAS